MTSKLTRERLEKIKSWRETYGARSNVMLPAEEAEELARIALAAMDSEPVAYMYRDNLHLDARFSLESKIGNWSPEDINEYEISETPLYRHAQPAPVVPVVPECFVRFHDIIKERHHGRMPEEVQNAFDECAAMLQAGNSPVIPDGLIAAVNRLLDSDGSRGVIARSAATTHVRK